MYLKLNGIELSCPRGTRWGELLSHLPGDGAGALGIAVGGRTDSLDDPAQEYAFARTLTYADEEGRRIYERSAQFIFLTAAHRQYPGQRVRIRHSFGRGLYIDLPGMRVDDAVARALEEEMRDIVAADLPIRKFSVSKKDAQGYFKSTGQIDRMRILDYRKFDYFTMFRIDGVDDYFYGEMASHTGLISAFALRAYGDGLMLLLPSADEPSRAAPFKDSPMLLKTYGEAARWHTILRCENVADLNDMVKARSLREFIRVNEALHERRVQQIADAFVKSGARVLLIAGPSSSGKTTFSHRMAIALRVQGLRPVKLSLDDYYLNRDEIPLEPDGSLDLEKIETLDLPLLSEHLSALLRGEEVQTPVFNFNTGRREAETHPFRVEPGQPLIIEGIHGVNDRLTASVPREMKFKVYISPLTMLNLDDHNRIRTTDARLLRRIVRDWKFRGTSPEATMDMWPSVRRGEERYIFPFQETADVMFNSSLTYELPIMKKYAYEALCQITPESPHYTQARRLVKFLNYIQTADVEDEIPVNSILREFIGGCCFYMDED